MSRFDLYALVRRLRTLGPVDVLRPLRDGETARVEPTAVRPIVVRNETGVEGFGDSIAAAQADLDEVVRSHAEIQGQSA